MALNEDLCNEVYNQEKIWINQINNNLINPLYCDYVLKSFYLTARKKMKESLDKDNNLSKSIEYINKILEKIEEFANEYRNGNETNITSLIPFLLINQINNNKDNIQGFSEFDKLSIKSQVQRYLSKDPIDKIPDYVYDDFPLDNQKKL